ncbi:MAG: hypothetical protein ABL902_07660 [Gallionella sp.]|nr:hypothetical protein [Gallionella sp.]
MAEPLKNQFGMDIPAKIAGMISAVYGKFSTEQFVRDVLHGYDELNLFQRGKKIADALSLYLPYSTFLSASTQVVVDRAA